MHISPEDVTIIKKFARASRFLKTINHHRHPVSAELTFQAFGDDCTITISAEAYKQHMQQKGNLLLIAQATFQDARDKRPILISDSVSIWKPARSHEFRNNFVAPDDARVCLSLEKQRAQGNRAIDPLEFRLVSEVRDENIEPDQYDEFLISSHRSRTATPVGKWFLRFTNDDHKTYIKTFDI